MTAAPFDRLYDDMNAKWGIDRLIGLVSPETASRFGSAFDKMNAAIAANDPKETAVRVGVCMRGLAAMDAEATAAGHAPTPPRLIEGEVEGFHFGIVPDDAFRKAYEAERPDLVLFTLHQVGIAMKDRLDNSPAVKAAREHFPNAKVTAVRPLSNLEQELGDEIPF